MIIMLKKYIILNKQINNDRLQNCNKAINAVIQRHYIIYQHTYKYIV